MRAAFVGLVFALGAIAPSAQAQDCEHEDALARAAAELSLQGSPSPAQLSRALRAAGSDLPHASMITSRSDGDRVTRWLRSLAGDQPGHVVCGRAEGDDGEVVVAARRGGQLSFERGYLDVTVGHGYRDAHLVLTDGAGDSLRLALRLVDRQQRVRLPEDLATPAQVQLVATAREGPIPLSQITVGAAVSPPTVGSSDGRQRLAQLREDTDALPLRHNRLLQEVAEEHSVQVCRSGRVGHMAQGADPEERLRQHGVRARVVGEVVARATSEGAAFDALVESPSHRATMVDRRLTDVGMATARGPQGHTCVVVLFAAWPRLF